MRRLLMPSPLLLLLLLHLPGLVLAQDQHAAIHSTKGVQHKLPLISDDFIVGCIMIMFLLLFAFGACGRVASARAATVSDVACRAACCSQASSKFARSALCRVCCVQREARCLRKLPPGRHAPRALQKKC